MFQRRVKIFLAVLLALTIVLIARLVQLQVVEQKQWAEQAFRSMIRPQLLETIRGRLVDRRGRVIAEDVACIDACVDYRAIPKQPDEKWVRSLAESRLKSRRGDEYRQADPQFRRQLLEEEITRVHRDLTQMWQTLADFGGLSLDDIDEIRQSIVRKVEMRRRFVWYRKYQLALERQAGRQPSPWYRRWLIDQTQQIPELDRFDETVAEQTEAHVILRAISNDANNYLGKNLDRFPGLELRPSMHRYYPYGDVGAHVIGHLSRVSRQDLEEDPHAGDELRQYWPDDLIGRTGLEALCEPILRGVRGRIERFVGEQQREVARTDPIRGQDAQTTIDIELQRDVQRIFSSVVLERRGAWRDTLAMPGAAVVIDVPSGQVLALVSYPSYDLNRFDGLFASLAADDINRPIMNRATQFALVPGSTVKPIIGLAAVAEGLIGVNDTIECTGYLQLGGRTYKTQARCWVASNFFDILNGQVAHHPIPWEAPHPTGFLDLRDAIERSCNVYFETLGDRLGIAGEARWFDRFGLGRPTGVGIAEATGKLPGDDPIPAYRRRAAAWFAAIGQDQLLATPIQMANVAATIARGGIWVRPRLLAEDIPTTKKDSTPDWVDLKLPPQAVAAVREGMIRVVNSRAGTGSSLRRDDIVVAGKTGSAQAEALMVCQRDESGRIVYRTVQVPQMDEKGNVILVEKKKPVRKPLELGTHDRPNELAPWYRGTGDKEDRRSHAWFIGFAPADDPKIAFAVLVEYGGGGGATAGYVARQMLDACIGHGYLPRR